MSATGRRGARGRVPRRGRLLGLFALIAVAAVAAFVVATAGSMPRDSGVRGRVWLGPLTPVEKAGGAPGERPYAATIEVLSAAGRRVVVTTRSDAGGRFKVDLRSGMYVLQGVSPGRACLPHAAPVAVTVVAHRFTTATVSFDTGIW